MVRTAVAAFMVLAACQSARAGNEPPPMVCGQQNVLGLVQEQLSRAGKPWLIEPGSVGQVSDNASVGQTSGTDASVVHCAVRVHTVAFDTPRVGQAPVDVVSVYQYSLELRRNGIYLRLGS